MRPAFIKWARPALLAALASLFALPGTAAWAQVPDRQGFFGSIDGRWMWLGGDPTGSPQGNTAQTGDGPGGQIMLGYKISPNWDVALAGDVQGLMTQLTKLQNGTMSVDNNHEHFDLEAGYSERWWRVNAGLRGIHYWQGISYNLTGFVGSDQRDIYGIGPKIGAGARWGISDSLAVVGGANAALLYASYNDSGNGVLAPGGGYGGMIPQLDAELGVNWRSSDNPLFSMTVGGRVAGSLNTSITPDGTHRGTLVEAGPFVRLAYNFAGPTRAMALTADTDDSAAPPLAAPGSYLVFFDFDRDELSPVASGLIRRAADDARYGKTAILRIASHAERAGNSDYNRALALRRANVVSDALVRLGLPADQISVHGVREARNQHIQIVF
jgi:outer membrane protein OmpA-like peptidoglycan-associated protein